jgi:hypothetical protein
MHLDVPESSVREEMVITSPNRVKAYNAKLLVVLDSAIPYTSMGGESRQILPFST